MSALLGGSVLLLAACGSERGAPSGEPAPEPEPTVTAVVPVEPRAAQRSSWGGFDEGVLVVDGADGLLAWCVLVAATAEERARGLMDAPDADLGGYDGMAFTWDGDSVTGGFWMKDTELPLSLAYIGDDGEIVSTVDMEPCPPSASSCPSYPPEGPYRVAVEVPQGRLGDLGIEAGATVVLEARSCTSP